MLNPSHPSEVRRHFRTAWQRAEQGLPLSPLQALLVDVLAWHPEYRAIWDDPAAEVATERAVVEVFLHLSLHVALREAVSTDRPRGIHDLARGLATRRADLHAAEHAMMECLKAHLSKVAEGGQAGEAELLQELRRL